MIELSTSEAARVFDAHPVTLLNLIQQGRLEARKDADGHWRINRKSLEAWNKKRLAKRAARVTRQIKRRRATLTQALHVKA